MRGLGVPEPAHAVLQRGFHGRGGVFAGEHGVLRGAHTRAHARYQSASWLEELADRSIFSLSGGEKQRIAYASSWAPHPANLVLDEPTSNLDEAAIPRRCGATCWTRRRRARPCSWPSIACGGWPTWPTRWWSWRRGASRGASTARRFGRCRRRRCATWGCGCALWPTSGRASGGRRAMRASRGRPSCACARARLVRQARGAARCRLTCARAKWCSWATTGGSPPVLHHRGAASGKRGHDDRR
ncbi:MAG: ATP-binding cassette domain-containing protein [Eggerthella lenta]